MTLKDFECLVVLGLPIYDLTINTSFRLGLINAFFFWDIIVIIKGLNCLSSSGLLYIDDTVVFNEYEFPYVYLFSPPISNTSSPSPPPILFHGYIISIPIVPPLHLLIPHVSLPLHLLNPQVLLLLLHMTLLW